MLRIEGMGLEMTRGDSIRFVIRLEGREVADETPCLFTVKRTPWAGDRPVVEVEIPTMENKVYVVLGPDETDLLPGEYVWDLRMRETAEDGTQVETPMAYAPLRVLEAIGR